mgnify:CR=1 FL=1
MSNKRLILTKDQNKAEKIIKAIYKNDGYCPCRLTKSEDTKCPCKEMMEKQDCHCGLFE